jgi:hypothetical protein
MFATKNIQLKFLKIILIILKTMTNVIALTLYFGSLLLYMFINHLTEGVEGITEHIKLDEEDIYNDLTKNQ